MKNSKRGLVVAIAAAVILCLSLARAAATSVQRDTARMIPLPELEHPRQICVEGGRVYILDARDIIVYDLKDGRLLMRIGRGGQGPGEFTMGPGRLAVFPDRLVIEDFHKIMRFNLDGKYLDQIMEPGYLKRLAFLPVGNNFVGFSMRRRNDGTLAPAVGCVYDKDLKLIKEFYGALPPGPPPPPAPGSPPPAKKEDVLLVRDYVDYAIFENKIFVADSRKGIFISVFDENGVLLREIRHPAEKVKIPKSYFEAALKERQKSKYWEISKASFNFIEADYFPAMAGFKIDGGRIYIITPAEKGGFYEVIVMDLEGRVQETSFRFPLKPNFAVLESFALTYDVENDAFVWFDYNDAKETYELHIR